MANLSIRKLPQDWIFPTTRYRGSKRKILPWIWQKVNGLSFDTTLDLFGGTASVSLLFKRMGKQVTCNDYLRYNYLSGVALIENSAIVLTNEDLAFLLSDDHDTANDCFIADTFRGYYFLDDENRWIDKTIVKILSLDAFYSGKTLRLKQALAIWALGQACLIKRPFNLFHRRNLKLRIRDVFRSFGNKSTWETPFPVAMRRFVEEANQAIFDNGHQNKALCLDAFQVEQVGYDLVYLDPPYFFENPSDVEYRELYHFLDGIAEYRKWPRKIDYTSYSLRLKRDVMRWPARSPNKLIEVYSTLIDRFKDSIIVISHKSGSLIPMSTIRRILIEKGKKVHLYKRPYKYALNKSNGKPIHNSECLFVAT